MQLFKGLVTLGILITGCVTSRYTDLGWAEIAARAGDQDEFSQQIERFHKSNPGSVEPFLLQLRLGVAPLDTPLTPTQQKIATLASASPKDLVALSRQNFFRAEPMRRPLMRAMLKAHALKDAEGLAEGAHEHLLIALKRGDPVTTKRLLAQLSTQTQPSDAAIRDLTTALRQLEPTGSSSSHSALKDLAASQSAGKALKTLKSAPEDDCLAAIVGGLALEDLGQPAAATERLERGQCVTARAHWARLGMTLSPQEARLVMEQLLEAAPLNRTALTTARLLFSPDHPLHVIATQRLAAWVPTDTAALAAVVELEQREGRWLAAAKWMDRSLRFRWDESLHTQALRSMIKGGASERGHPLRTALYHRLEWLRGRRPELAKSIDQVLSGEAPAYSVPTP